MFLFSIICFSLSSPFLNSFKVTSLKSFDSDITTGGKKGLFAKLFHNVKKEVDYYS